MSEDWLARWKQGRIGFHEGAPNAWLADHASVLGPGAGRRVIVPLCGKSIDLAFLAAHGFEVVGIELSPLAAAAFFEEAGLTPVRTEIAKGVRLAANRIEIVVANFFELDRVVLGPFDAFFDRAAVVALPTDDRARYAATLRGLLAPDATGLLVTFEHDGEKTTPPYSVDEKEIERLWPTFDRVALGSGEITLTKPGATFCREHAYALRAR